MAGNNMDSLNSNEFSSEISKSNGGAEDPPSPILSSSKINRRIIMSKKLKRRRSKIKLNQQFMDDEFDFNLNPDNHLPEFRLKAIEQLKTERRKYYDLLCNTKIHPEVDNVDIHKQTYKKPSHSQESHNVFESGKKIYNYNTDQNKDTLNLKTAFGKNITIPQQVVNKCKYIFKDIFNDHLLNSSILKCPVQSKQQKTSKIPVLNRNIKPKLNIKNVKNIEQSQTCKANSQLKSYKETVINNSFGIPQGQEAADHKTLDEDFAITKSFIEAAQNIIEEDNERQSVMCNFQCIDPKENLNSMSKLYSNPKFQECSSSTNSLESLKHSLAVHTISEISIHSSEVHTESIPSRFPKANGNKNFIRPSTECEELSVMDIVNDDWSDTMHVLKDSGIKKDFFSRAQNKSCLGNEMSDGKYVLHNIVKKDGDIRKTEERSTIGNLEKTSQQSKTNSNIMSYQVDNDKNTQNNAISEGIDDIQNVKRFENNDLKQVSNLESLFETNDKSSDIQNNVISSKSVIHVNIPANVFDCSMKPLYSKNLIELHRNRNFLGNSEDSVSNIDYKLSEHNIQVRQKIVKTHRKIIDDEILGFDKSAQESANQKAIILFNNIKKIEEEINDKELLARLKNKEEKKPKGKKSKKHKSENGDEKEKDNNVCLKEPNVKHERKNKEKKHDKLSAGNTKPNGTFEQIATNEEINRTVTYDHISIISEQSCKKYKGHKRRKSVTTAKEVICQKNNNNNQVIQISPNQKKFKIEIDCNNKFHINICCNGLQNTSDKEIVNDVEDTKLNCKAIEDSSMKSMFKCASGKDIILSKKHLNDAEKKFEEENCLTNKTDNNTQAKHNSDVGGNSKNSERDDLKCDKGKCFLNESDKGNLVKKTLNGACKLYQDIVKSDTLSNSQSDISKRTDFYINSMSKLKDKNFTSNECQIISSSGKKENLETKLKQKVDTNTHDFTAGNFCGFKSASGKNFKVSERAIKRAQAIYKCVDEKLNEQTEKIDHSETILSTTNDKKIVEDESSKQRTRILYTDIDNNDPCLNIKVPLGHKLIDRKLVRDEVVNESVQSPLNEEHNNQNKVSIQSGQSNSTSRFSCGFQSASGKDINISSDSLEKAKHFFDESGFPAGDSSNPLVHGFNSASDTKIDISDKSVLEAKCEYEMFDNVKLCMGDFNENMPLNNSISKKAFELLEDVVETVDSAIEKIRKGKVSRPINPRKRLGISRCKQINISREKVDKAKRLFSNESFSESIRDLSVLGTPKMSQIGFNSTPLKGNMSSMKDVQFTKATIESEITPIKGTTCDNINCETTNQENSAITMQKKTPGTIDDWHGTILKQINSVRETLTKLEEKKYLLEKQMSFIHYSNKEHRRKRSGVLYNNKMTNDKKISLESLQFKNENCNIENVISNVILENADMIHFNFSSLDNESTTEDGAIIIPNSENLVGLSEIDTAFRTMIGVEPDLIPKSWIANHYRLIVWKLASYERVFPQQMKGSLSIENIVQQLKYRYDREIDRAQRPAIRKILEKDDISQKRIILCVSDIIQVPNNRIELELTDGWYCIRTIIDNPLIWQVQRKKIKIGTKLVIYGAQLLNCDGCHPLEVTDLVKLKVSYNCTRRALWYAKLGYQKFPEPFIIPLSSVHPDGGMIGCIKVHIVRVYPIRYMEQIDNKKVWRNSKAEEKYSNTFENERLEKIEKIHYSVQEKFERDLCLDMKNMFMEGSKLNKTEILKITCPKILLGLLESSSDPENLIETLSPSQRVSILEYRQHMCLQREQEISKRISKEMDRLKLTKRKVVPILKLLVLDDYFKSEKPQQFCIWNPKEDDISLLKEGISLTVYNVVPRSNGDLFSNSKTYFKVNNAQTKTSHTKFKRNLFPISMTLDSYYQPIFNEFDTIGLVVQVEINTHDQNLWITDSTGRMLLIKIKDGPEVCSLLDGIVRGHVISLLNLIYCKPQKDFGQAFANQFTIISSFSQHNYLEEQFELFKMKLPEDISQLLEECDKNIEKYKIKIDLKQSCFITSFMENSPKSFGSTFDISDDSTLIPSRLTATDVAMSLIDTDTLT